MEGLSETGQRHATQGTRSDLQPCTMALFEIVHTSQATPDLPPEAVAEFLDKA